MICAVSALPMRFLLSQVRCDGVSVPSEGSLVASVQVGLVFERGSKIGRSLNAAFGPRPPPLTIIVSWQSQPAYLFRRCPRYRPFLPKGIVSQIPLSPVPKTRRGPSENWSMNVRRVRAKTKGSRDDRDLQAKRELCSAIRFLLGEYPCFPDRVTCSLV